MYNILNNVPEWQYFNGESHGKPLDLRWFVSQKTQASFQALNEVNQSASEMAAMKLDVPVMPVGESDGPDDCQVQ